MSGCGPSTRAARTGAWGGPYLAERAWGTVREDYSAYGDAWVHFDHDQARARVYRWNEDGLAGICDRHQLICFAIALWNGRDPILKERLFGVSGNEGNHGEDVKEQYFYLDCTPTHSYMKYLHKYPQAEFPYARLVAENRARDKQSREFELLDTGVFHENRYFDVFVEYAKGSPEDILIRITAANRGPEAATIHLLPTVWFRNTWSWGNGGKRPILQQSSESSIELEYPGFGRRRLVCEGTPETLFTENDTNFHRLFGGKSGYAKDGINDYVIHGRVDAINPSRTGTKAAARYVLTIDPGQSATVRLRLSGLAGAAFDADFERIFAERQREAEEFYATVVPEELSDDARNVMRQSFAGLLWSKQFYHYVVRDWINGDPTFPLPPEERKHGRNREWGHLYNADVISMPDKWEYPWYAAWDLAFHALPLSIADPDFAKSQMS